MRFAMPEFRVHRMKENPRQNFRWSPHAIGVSHVKPKDFEPCGHVEAGGFYEAWMILRGTDRALLVGDVLESCTGELRIFKYVGLEEAQWVVAEQQPPLGVASDSAEVGASLPCLHEPQSRLA
jgi:hypothetical protein